MLKVSSIEAHPTAQIYQSADIDGLDKKNNENVHINPEMAFGSGSGVLKEVAGKFSKRNILHAIKEMRNPFKTSSIANENIFAQATESISGIRKSSPVNEIPTKPHPAFDGGIAFEPTVKVDVPMQFDLYAANAGKSPEEFFDLITKPSQLMDAAIDEDLSKTDISIDSAFKSLKEVSSGSSASSPISTVPHARRDENGKLLPSAGWGLKEIK